MYTYPDQEAMNHVFKGKIKMLPEKFNAWSITKDPYAKPFVIRHFTGITKPWDKNHKDKRDVDLWNSYHTRDL